MIETTESESSMAPIKHFLLKVASLKYFYIICLILFFIVAFLNNKYSSKVYETSTLISPVENKTSSLLSQNQAAAGGLTSIESLTNIENEMNNLVSFSLVYKTIADMNFEVSYFREKPKIFKMTGELYGQSPFTITIDKSHIQPIEAEFFIKILDESSFRLTASEKKVSTYNYLDNLITSKDNPLLIDTICKFNETINNRMFRFSVSLNKDNFLNQSGSEYRNYFTFRHLDYLAKEYLGTLKVEKVSPLASVIKIQFRGRNLEKTISFLNRYISTFLEENLAKKNKIALSTVNFIDSQISTISDSLVKSESKLKNYRSANQVMDLSFQGQRVIEQRTQIETERTNLQAQERYFTYVINLFKASKDLSGVVPPSAMNVADPTTNQLISELLNLYSQRSNVTSGNSNEKNIFLGQIDNKIATQRKAIIENFTNNLNTLTLSLNELNYREDKLSKEISSLPKTEMNMVGMQRKFNLNDNIYTYLLQKRSEAAITLASNYPDFEIIEPARYITSHITSPKRMINYILALFFGLIIPSLYLLIREIFDDKIRSINDLEYMLQRTVLSTIYSNKNKSDMVVAEFPKSAISESFRNLRSSLFLKCASVKSRIILITSSQPSDGKSFVSLNLASSIASVGYKTIIIDADMRRPNQHIKMKTENTVGLSNYMTKNAKIVDIIQKTSIENLSFISAGPIIPNPSELLESGGIDELINYLKTIYEYIIIDSTPVGIVADATLVMKYATSILLVIRHNYTGKEILKSVISILNTNKFNNYEIVYNDLNLQKSSYKHYSNYYIEK
jgi:capsular exopolysaccharide synthesis family protein